MQQLNQTSLMQYPCQSLFLRTLPAQAACRATDASRQVDIALLNYWTVQISSNLVILLESQIMCRHSGEGRNPEYY
jgi:hypothetical protein